MIQQIPKIRIGNTIHVGIAVMAGGQPRDLTGLVLTVVLVDNRGSKARINGWTIEGEHNNVIRFTLQGFTQNNCGIYKVIVYENANKPNQAVVDSRLFELVRESAMEEGVDSGLIDKDVDLQIGGVLIGGRDGTGIADIEQVQSSSMSLGENIWKIALTDGREYNIVIKNGAQGQKGDDGEDGHTPVKGVDYFTQSEISDIKEGIKNELSGDFYTKPSGGIPKNDLSDEVKTSLGKADTALQSFTESDPTVPAWAKQPNKPTYTAQEVGALPASTPIPTKTSDLDNDSGFLTQHQDISGKQDVIDDLQTIRSGAAKGETALQSFTETDPTVPSWAKQSSKPSYTASEVGALPDTTKYAGSQSVGGAANKAVSIPIGVVDNSSTNLAYTATVDGITELREGILCALKLNMANVFGPTLNVNNLGAKPIYISTDANVISGNMMKTNSLCIFIYTNRIEGGCWEFYGGYNADFVGKCLGDYYGLYKMKEVCKGRVLLVMYSESELLPLYSGEQDTGTNKTLTTESFDPFGEIFYTTSSFNKNSYPSLGSTWKQYYVDMRYSFNVGTTLQNYKSVYMVCVPQSDGRVKLASNPISQTLPTTEDGFLYILLGTTYSNKDIELFMHHPIYYFKDGAIRQWTNQDTTALKLGTSTVGGTTQGIYLNQGVPAACESYDMWYMKHIAALYGATRNDATGLWSYYYKQCARWDDTQEKIVWDRNIGYDDITDEEMMDMCDHRLHSLQGVYGYAKAMRSRIALHFIGYGNNQGAAQPCAYIGNNYVVTYGYVGQKGGANGNSYFPWHLQDTFLVSKVKNVIGRSGPSGATVTAPAGSLLEYATVTFNANNQTLNFGTCPNIEFVSIMYTLTDGGGTNRTGCTLILHPDVYAKIFDSTNADYALWHKIDLANQARTNPITIQSA